MTTRSKSPVPPTARTSAVSRYAYFAEAALWDYQCGQILYFDQSLDFRRACVVFAEAAQAALIALQRHAGGVTEPHGSPNLMRCLRAIQKLDERTASLLNRDGIEEDLQLLSRVLRDHRRPVGRDYLLRDFYGYGCVADCKDAAEPVVEAMTFRLLGMGLETSLSRLWRVRQPPMVDTAMWERLGARAGRRMRR